MLKDRRTRSRIIIILIVICSLHIFTNVGWLIVDDHRLQDDPMEHLRRCLNRYDDFHIRDFICAYPPLPYLLPFPLFALFHPSVDLAVGSFLIFYPILIVSVYGIGRQLAGNSTALVAALLATLYPGIFAYSRRFFQVFPLTAILCCSVYLAILSNQFKHRYNSILLGLTIGVGMLIRWTYLFFFIGPMLLVSIKPLALIVGWARGTRTITDKDRDRLRNLFVCLLAAALLALPWYLASFKS
ncbi:glycosyltransferase family 39 protein, partial [Thermodesulfobacteriota bacterium]